jgi:hypothetical protein
LSSKYFSICDTPFGLPSSRSKSSRLRYSWTILLSQSTAASSIRPRYSLISDCSLCRSSYRCRLLNRRPSAQPADATPTTAAMKVRTGATALAQIEAVLLNMVS